MESEIHMAESRTKKTVRNTIFSFAYKLCDTVMAFLLRTLFIRALGMTYLGLSGLFTNILTVLSLMELGVGSAIVFSLYEPLAVGDHAKVVTLMQLYKRVYNIIGVLICVIGAALTPFLHYIVNLPQNIDGLYLIYWITIANTSVTYFLSYRRSLLIADQRSDINTQNLILFRFIRFFLQSVVLLLFHNYLLFLIVDVILTLMSNIHVSYLILKRYPYLKKTAPEVLSRDQKRNLLKYMSSGILSRIGQTVVNCSDNILISAFISTVLVGVYSNYSMVTSNLDILVYMLFNGVTASVGNFAVNKSKNEAEALFRKINYVNYGVSYCITTSLFALFSPFVTIWVGSDYLLSDITIAVVTLNFYITISQKSLESFMGAVGELFYYNRYRSIIEAISNLLVSVLLVKYTNLGITGVFLGTTVCFVLGRIWMDARTLYRHWFSMSVKSYYFKYFLRMGFTAATALLFRLLSNAIFACLGLNVFTFILTGCVTMSISLLLFWGTSFTTEEYLYYRDLVRKKLGTIRKNDFFAKEK